MDLFGLVQIPYAISGLGVGFIVGLSGVGGGALMTPLLVLFFGMHPAAAVGTDLLYASITKGFGTIIHGIGKSIEWRVVGLLAAGSLPATLITTMVLREFDTGGPELNKLITLVLAYALLVTALGLVCRRPIQRWVERSTYTLRTGHRTAVTVAFGAALGMLVTISSVGAGSLGVMALLLLYPLLSTSRVVGTDIAHAVPLTMIAGLGHLGIGTVNLVLLGSLLAGSIPGVTLGSLLSPRIPETALRMVLATVLSLVGVMLLLK